MPSLPAPQTSAPLQLVGSGCIKKMANPNAAPEQAALAHPRVTVAAGCWQLGLLDPTSGALQHSMACTAGEWHQPLCPRTQMCLPLPSLWPEADPGLAGARTLVMELEEGHHSAGPALRLGGCVHQHAQGCACQQPRILVQGLDSQERQRHSSNPHLTPRSMLTHANYAGSRRHPDAGSVSAGSPQGKENRLGRMALLSSLGQAAPSLPGAVHTFPHATSSSSPRRLCRASLFPFTLHTRGPTSFGSAWKSWRQAWRRRRRDGGCGDG